MKTLIFSAFLFFSVIWVGAQVAPNKYFIEFTDKNNSPYSISRPEEFLSERALQRRAGQYISVTEEDLPVNPSYVEQVANTGVIVLTRSKWFNGITIHTTDTTKLNVILSFSFVKKVVKDNLKKNCTEPVPDKMAVERSFLPFSFFESEFVKSSPSGYNYGPSFRQIQMLNGNVLHEQGFRGEGKVIAVLDAGFLQVDKLKAFDSLWKNNQILGVRDFVSPGSNVFEGHIHGMMVLSVIGGNVPGMLIGTAPEANFWLLRSEDGNTENIIEEYNWISAAEFADSAGADIITSSLGYTRFDDQGVNHTCEDMDGHTTPVTRGANKASLKGMVVVSSAGNEGGSGWKCISAPADGDNVIGVGAVDSSGNYAGFSSTGVVDGDRVKPNITAMGQQAVVFWTNDSIVRANGTSFSCPIIAGMTACLWQSRPEATPDRLYRTLEESSNQFNSPDSLKGYGIPDFAKAMNLLSVPEKDNIRTEVFPNPFTCSFTVRYSLSSSQNLSLSVFDYMGKIVFERKNISSRVGENQFHFDQADHLSEGFYLLRLQSDSFSEILRIIKCKP